MTKKEKYIKIFKGSGCIYQGKLYIRQRSVFTDLFYLTNYQNK